MKPIFILLVAATFIVGCNNETKEKETTPTSPVTNCYSYVNGKDSIFLTTTMVHDTVIGKLAYHIFEKDSNTGTITGVIENGILLVDYTFMSEGVESVRRVAFKKKGNSYLEGYGEMEDKEGKKVFSNPGSLQFNSQVVLSEVNCEK